MRESIIGGLVAVACIVGIAVGIVYISERVKCFDMWPFSPSKVCAVK